MKKLVGNNCWIMVLGAYDDEEAAAHAYDLAALKYWGGQDTILNFPVSFHYTTFLLLLFSFFFYFLEILLA